MGNEEKAQRKVRNTPGQSHYQTSSTLHKHPYLHDERICKALARSIRRAAKKYNFVVLAYVFMPDHMHLLIHPLDEEYSMETIMKAIKQGSSRSAKVQGWIDTELWERGGGYDRNVFSERARTNAIGYIHRNPVVDSLVEDALEYRWSSARWYVTGMAGDVPCRYFASLFED